MWDRVSPWLKIFQYFILMVYAPFMLVASVYAVEDQKICEIQGSGMASPFENQYVRVRGVVTVDLDTTTEKGFYLQDENCDSDPETSDAVFIFLGERREIVATGDLVTVEGWVDEFNGLTEISTEPELVFLEGSERLPATVHFSPPSEFFESRLYFEAHEGMLIHISRARIVGPTTARGLTFIVDDKWNTSRIFRGEETGAIIPIGGKGLHHLDPGGIVGDVLTDIIGVLGIGEDDFEIFLSEPIDHIAQEPPDLARDSSHDRLRFASLNLHNLFDTFDDPNKLDSVLTVSKYQTRLEKLALLISEVLGEPTFLGVQEAENAAVLQALANRPEISSQYGFVIYEGPDIRGIDVALMYRLDQVRILSSESRQACTSLIDGLGPDGNQNPGQPENTLSCHVNSASEETAGNRLFSRPPLFVHLVYCVQNCQAIENWHAMWVINVHLKSKSQDTNENAVTAARRLEQASVIASWIDELHRDQPAAHIVLLGDFNDFPDSSPIKVIEDSRMQNLILSVPDENRYTFNYRGISQALDYIFVNANLLSQPNIKYFEKNWPVSSDYPAYMEKLRGTFYRASDHDPIEAAEILFTEKIYLPLLWIVE